MDDPSEYIEKVQHRIRTGVDTPTIISWEVQDDWTNVSAEPIETLRLLCLQSKSIKELPTDDSKQICGKFEIVRGVPHYYLLEEAHVGSFIGKYSGQFRITTDPTASNNYSKKGLKFSILDIVVVIDASEFGNGSQCLNITSFQEQSNASAEICYNPVTKLPAVGIFATKNLEENDEIVLHIPPVIYQDVDFAESTDEEKPIPNNKRQLNQRDDEYQDAMEEEKEVLLDSDGDVPLIETPPKNNINPLIATHHISNTLNSDRIIEEKMTFIASECTFLSKKVSEIAAELQKKQERVRQLANYAAKLEGEKLALLKDQQSLRNRNDELNKHREEFERAISAINIKH